MTPEDTPRMAERTDRQAQIDPWEQWRRIIYPHIQPEVFVRFLNDHTAEGWDGTRAEMDALTTVLDAARAADAALLRERDAQIASLDAHIERQNTFIGILDKRIVDSGVAQEALGSKLVMAESVAKNNYDACERARAERDAAQQAHSELASLVGAALVYATLDSEAGEKPTAEPDHALTETVWKLVQQRGRMESALATVRDCIIALTPGHRTGYDWNTDPLYLTRKEGQALAAIDAALSSSPRQQEPQPPEPPKPTEPRKPVVNLMEALKKSLDSLNAKPSQEPGGHQP